VATFNNAVEVMTSKQLSIRKISFARGNAIFCNDPAFAYRFWCILWVCTTNICNTLKAGKKLACLG